MRGHTETHTHHTGTHTHTAHGTRHAAHTHGIHTRHTRHTPCWQRCVRGSVRWSARRSRARAPRRRPPPPPARGRWKSARSPPRPACQSQTCQCRNARTVRPTTNEQSKQGRRGKHNERREGRNTPPLIKSKRRNGRQRQRKSSKPQASTTGWVPNLGLNVVPGEVGTRRVACHVDHERGDVLLADVRPQRLIQQTLQQVGLPRLATQAGWTRLSKRKGEEEGEVGWRKSITADLRLA